MRIFLTERKYREAVRREAEDPARDPAYLLKLYSENPRLLKRAVAAFNNVSPEAIDKCNVTQSSTLFAPFARVLRAVADGLQEERAGL